MGVWKGGKRLGKRGNESWKGRWLTLHLNQAPLYPGSISITSRKSPFLNGHCFLVIFLKFTTFSTTLSKTNPSLVSDGISFPCFKNLLLILPGLLFRRWQEGFIGLLSLSLEQHVPLSSTFSEELSSWEFSISITSLILSSFLLFPHLSGGFVCCRTGLFLGGMEMVKFSWSRSASCEAIPTLLSFVKARFSSVFSVGFEEANNLRHKVSPLELQVDLTLRVDNLPENVEINHG